MKIREGFVSNSSTTSFCICGIYESEDKIKEMFGVENKWVLDSLDKILEAYQREYSDYIYFGASIGKMKDDETKAEFKERIKALLDKKAGKDVGKIDFHTDGWYDG